MLLFALSFLLMPFNVFGLKGRLDQIEARLDDIQGEIRALTLRLPEPDGSSVTRPPATAARPPSRAPIPPMQRPDHDPDRLDRHPEADQPRRPAAPSEDAAEEAWWRSGDRGPSHASPLAHAPPPPSMARPPYGRRSEPRLDWPR
ncbi:hypothetical protein [Limobrevibacterium gyesilva]|uniref:Uncharacterized protein n=1 Tax=Limobrevibacterium gyesilva TaxID=2991712 RepID=A0AA41YN15_9PROT|nr:hypothetical protein [Limobrevibacterium gyesilva]MCW3473305.1 hypothetical protein [Limobrevibacterium gyesilva]